MVWQFLSGALSLFLLALSILFLSLVSLLIQFLNCAFSFVSVTKLFKLLSSLFLSYSFGADMKLKFLFKSLYSLFEKETLLN